MYGLRENQPQEHNFFCRSHESCHTLHILHDVNIWNLFCSITVHMVGWLRFLTLYFVPVAWCCLCFTELTIQTTCLCWRWSCCWGTGNEHKGFQEEPPVGNFTETTWISFQLILWDIYLYFDSLINFFFWLASVTFSTRCLKKDNVLALDGEATAILPSLIKQWLVK